MGREIIVQVVNPATNEVIEDIGYVCGRTDASNFLANYIYNIAKEGDSQLDFAYDSKAMKEIEKELEGFVDADQAEYDKAEAVYHDARAARCMCHTAHDFLELSKIVDQANKFLKEWYSAADSILSDLRKACECIRYSHEEGLMVRVINSD